ncbi:MAG: selenide, water dikinase SelD [Proteobacteria bacterium]|nr:selenide, water dikinase SelD [Pseudomonadota bacterium]
MQTSSTPILKDLVLVGGGHSHVAVLRRFGMRPLPGVRLTLIARDLDAAYSGMLPGLIAGHYEFDQTHIDLGPLARFAGARLYHDEVIGLDLDAKRVLCRNRPPVAFDLLSLNIGSAPNTADVPGAAAHAIPVKPIDRFVAHWDTLWRRVLARPSTPAAPTRIGVVGAGAGGVELLLAVRHRLAGLFAAAGLSADGLQYHVITDAPDILPSLNARARQKFARVLAARGVKVHTDARVVRVEEGELHCAGGFVLLLDEILWVTAAGAAPWLRETGLALDDQGFIAVDERLQSVSHPDVFAAGDIASVGAHPRPKSGVFAVRQGRPLADNLRRRLLGRAARPFRPQRKFLSLISTGDKYAVAVRGDWALEGRLVWRWKDWIDRRFIAKYNDLPDMAAPAAARLPAGLADRAVIKEISAIAMRCGGCGAKVGSSVLTRALAALEPVRRNDVVIGLDAPDDAAAVDVPAGKLMVHSVDYFRAFIEDPYVFGQIAANHALGDIFAMGAEPQTALAIATVPYGIEAKVEDVLFQMMSGALAVFRDANTALVGGHTSEGAELALGFAVNGLADRDHLLRKGGMRPGDRLILTKALGTGTLLAADMRHQAKGRWVDGALASMLQSNRAAAGCVFHHGAHACTDVTGFGLLGHLVEMTKPSAVDVALDLAAVPLLDGALETVRRGILSSLQPENVRLRRAIRNLDEAAKSERYPLIFDPQTAGGLLASVPGERAADCVAALHALGYARAAIIGEVMAQSDHPEPITLRL